MIIRLRIAIIVSIALTLAAGPARARTWRINVAGTGDVATIQAAVDASADGDSIVVAPGRYTWTNQGSSSAFGMVFVQRGQDRLVIRSEAGPQQTVIDAEFQGRPFFIQGWNYLTLDGFTIQNGVATTEGNFGGGALEMHLSYEVIRNCIFRVNSASFGGAVWCGGVSAPQFIDCQFLDNQAERGGAFFFINSSTSPTLCGCTLLRNRSVGYGGAIAAIHNGIALENTVIARNTSGAEGGAVYMRDAWASTLIACTIAENSAVLGSGIYLLSTPNLRVERCAVVLGDVEPYVSINGSGMTMVCSDTWHNGASDAFPAGVVDGGGNFSANPLFCGPAGSLNYFLNGSSPCVPGMHPGGGSCLRIGALGVACGSVGTKPVTWGRVKSLYH